MYYLSYYYCLTSTFILASTRYLERPPYLLHYINVVLLSTSYS
jgi:hypothetical protein